MADKDIEVTLNVNDTVYDIDTKPYKAVTFKREGESVHLMWTAKGTNATFPPHNYFHWKPGPVPAPGLPTRTSPTQLDLTYTVPNSPGGVVNWAYKICLTDGNVTVCEDPEAENLIPPTDDDRGHGRGPKNK